MAPRRSRAGAEGDRELVEKSLALEAAIGRIRGVVSAKVTCAPTGEVAAVDVLVKGASSKRIIRDIESACMAHLGRRLPSEALGVTRVPDEAAKGKRRLAAALEAAADAAGSSVRDAGEPGGEATEGAAAGAVAAEAVQAPKRYRVISRRGAGPAGARASRATARLARGPRSGEDEADEDLGFGARIGVGRVGISVYPDRVHATVELVCAGRSFSGECEGLPSEDKRFDVPVGAAMKALDRAFGGLVGISVDDVQVCRLSGKKTAVVLATVGSPWGDVPSTGASYATRSEEEAVIRALLHAVNRCVTLTYGGEPV